MEHQALKENHPGLYAVIDAAGTAHSKGMKSYLIMMAVRLLEMRRVLKDAGSLYLHCDPTASHYLKLTLDAIFGQDNSRNEIIWKRTSAHSDAKVMGAVHDCIPGQSHQKLRFVIGLCYIFCVFFAGAGARFFSPFPGTFPHDTFG